VQRNVGDLHRGGRLAFITFSKLKSVNEEGEMMGNIDTACDQIWTQSLDYQSLSGTSPLFFQLQVIN